MTKGDRWKVRHGWRSLGWAVQPSSGEPDTGEPDARKRACPVREGAVGFPRQQGAGRLPHSWTAPGATSPSAGSPAMTSGLAPGPGSACCRARTAPRVWYTLSNAGAEVALPGVAEAQGRRHGVEEVLQAGEGEVGLAHHEVRSWVGWHHHMTLSLLAPWFLTLEKRRLGKNAGADGASAARGVRPTAAARTAQPAANRRGGQSG